MTLNLNAAIRNYITLMHAVSLLDQKRKPDENVDFYVFFSL